MPTVCPTCGGELEAAPNTGGLFVCAACDGRYLQKSALKVFNVDVPQGNDTVDQVSSAGLNTPSALTPPITWRWPAYWTRCS